MSWVLFPDIPRFISRAGNNFFFAILNHLVCYFDEEPGHFVSRVVKPCDRVDHFNCIDKGWKRLYYLFRCAVIKRVNELFQCRQIFNIVLCLIELVS